MQNFAYILVLVASPFAHDGNAALKARDFAQSANVQAAPARGGAAQSASEQSLDQLIPQDAQDNPETWAREGVPPAETAERSDAQRSNSGPMPPTGGQPARIDLDAELDGLIVPEPQPLAPPETHQARIIDAPDLIDLPDLAELPLSDTLVLAFPLDPARFPEQTDFVERFRALSAIEALGSGEDTVPQLAARARSDEALLVAMLRTYGYYDAEVVRQLSGGRRAALADNQASRDQAIATRSRVRFDILPGDQFRFGLVDLGALDQLQGETGNLLREAFGIRPGDPLYTDRIVRQQAELTQALGENGFPFATLSEAQLLVDYSRQEGDLSLMVEPGGQYLIGGVTSADQSFLPASHLAKIARFEAGDLYRASLQSDLRRAVLATGLVSSVAVTPREISPPRGAQPGEVVFDVEMERAPLRTISGALGYGTEDGIKVEAGWEHRNLLPPEGALRVRGIVGTREQLASVTFRRSNFGARDQILTVDTYASAIETEAVDARTIALRTSFERVSNLLFQKPFSWQVGAEVLYTDERNRVIGGVPRPRQTYTIAGLFGAATIDSSDDLLDPKSGFRLTGFLAPEVSNSLGEESYYLRAQADASYYHAVSDTIVLASRMRAATIQGVEAFRIAPSRRLYAGGGGSVRGYGFQGIGPRNDFGEPTGGGSLVEAAIEARIQTGLLDDSVEVVPFLDAGSVALGSTPDFRFIRYGAGIGLRYKTSFGPIRVDVGAPLNPTQFDAPVVVYVSLGQAF